MNRVRLGAIASLGLLLSITCPAVPVGSGQGLHFAQLDLSFDATPQRNSSYGLASFDFGQLASSTGVGRGFLNIATSAGWVVQNMVVDLSGGQPGSSTMFNLGSLPGIAVGNLLAYADFSATPTTSFNHMPTTSFVVGKVEYNAQGRNAPVTAPLAMAATPVIGWLAGGATNWIQQSFRESVEQDVNQCGPGSFANSLQWLEDQYRVNVPDDHVPGILGKPAASLVGEIDRNMGRQPHQTVTDDQFMKGKLDTIAGNALAEELVVKHWGGGFAPGDRLSTDGSVSSRDESLSGISLIDWIIQEIADGGDVELALGGSVMHWINVTGAGRTLGVPWISWTHDAKQGYDDKGTADTGDDTPLRNGGTNWWDGGIGWSPIVNGRLVSFIAGATPDFAVSESVPEPGTLLLVGLALATLVLGLQRPHGKGVHQDPTPAALWLAQNTAGVGQRVWPACGPAATQWLPSDDSAGLARLQAGVRQRDVPRMVVSLSCCGVTLMKRNLFRITWLALCGFGSMTAIAAPPPADGQWRGTGGAALSATSGNSSTQAFMLGADMARLTAQDKITLGGAANYARGKVDGANKTTANKWAGFGQYDYNLSPSLFVFGKLGLEGDALIDLNLRSTVAGGLGLKIIDTKELAFSVFGGAAYSTDRYDTAQTIGSKTDTRFSRASLYLGEESSHQLSSTVSFKQRLELYPGLSGDKAKIMKFTAGLGVAMSGTMSLTVGLTDSYNSKPPAGSKKNDVAVFTGINVKFGAN